MTEYDYMKIAYICQRNIRILSQFVKRYFLRLFLAQKIAKKEYIKDIFFRLKFRIKKRTVFTVRNFVFSYSTTCDTTAKRFTDSALLSACFLLS